MASWAATQQAPLQQQKDSDAIVEDEQTMAVVEARAGCGEQGIRDRLAPYGGIAWCNRIDDGRYLVRFSRKEALVAINACLNGNSWPDGSLKITPYTMDHLLPSIQHDSVVARSESILALPQGQLDCLNLLITEANQQQQVQSASVAPKTVLYPELQPCHPQWTLASADEQLTPLEDEPLSLDEANSFLSSSGPSTSQLWTQKSIGAVARKDLAKFAALQSLVHQHSSNSSTPTAGLMQTSSLGLGSPWGSFSTGSTALDALPGVVRRVSSPAGHSTALTPRSNCDSFSGSPRMATTLADAGNTLQQQLGTGAISWVDNVTQLPLDLNAGGMGSRNGGICIEDSAALLRLQSLLAQQQQQQQQLQTGLATDSVPLLSTGLFGSVGFAPDDLLSSRALDNSSGDRNTAAVMAGTMMMGAVPPPPPPHAQHGVLGAPPPPPPARSDGRLSGSSSPVPAPPPRALTPGGGQPNWASPAGSPRLAVQQPLSPSNVLRGPARNGVRLFHPGMSNLGHGTLGGPGVGLVHQHSYDQAAMTGYLHQQQPLYRVGSPINRAASGMPPPPPPGLPPPGYVAASNAAAAGGICGSPIPPGSPGVGRQGGYIGIPLPAMSSAPAGLLEGLASSAKGGSTACAGSGAAADVANSSGQAAAGSAQKTAEPRPGLKADGVLFVQELLQLLKAGAAAGNTFLSNLADLLECALAAPGDDLSASAAGDSTDSQAACSAETGSCSTQQAMPVDAAAFLGILQEAAAPLIAAAAAGATAAAARGNSHQQSSRRGSHRHSDSSDDGDAASSLTVLGKQSQLIEPGKSLKPIRTSVPGGDSSDLDNTPPSLLLRQLLAGVSGSPAAFFPLHPRTTTSGGHGSSSSCGGTAPGTPHGTPMLLVPQTLPELLSARAALIRLMDNAHSFVRSPAYSKLTARLDGVAAVYDSMHDDPVTVKRRKCKEIAALREVVNQDQAFTQAVASLSSLRNHIYSLSRKVLIGYGHVEGLPVDLLLGGLTTELAAILTDPYGQPQPGSLAASSGTASTNSTAAEEQASTAPGPQSCMHQAVVDFFTGSLPLPKLALLVFAEFVSVDPSPCCMTPAPGATGCGNAAHIDAASCAAPAANNSSGSSTATSRTSNLKDRRSGATGSNVEGVSHGSSGGDNRESSGSHAERRAGNHRHSKDGEASGHNEARAGLQSQSSKTRGSGFNSNSAGGDTKQRPPRRSQQCEFDLVAEARELEAAATAAAPLVAAAVCDLPAGRSSRRGSNQGP